jgi:hypothetical protein
VTWDDVAITETAISEVTVAVDRDRVGVSVGSDRGAAAVRDNTRSVRYALADLGLTDLARAALVGVLRAGGRVRRPPGDPGMLTLGRALSHFLQLADPPFGFDQGVWVARFEADSFVPPSDR